MGAIRRSARSAVHAALAAALLAATNCGAGGGGAPDVPVPPADRYLSAGPHAAGYLELALADASRPTPPHGSHAGFPDRRIRTLVWYPATATQTADPLAERPDAEAAPGGPWPLVVYCHGFMSSGRENAQLAAQLATRGFVVAAVEFPLTGMTSPGGATVEDTVNEPADVRFVIDRLIASSADPAHRLHGTIDTARIGLAGVSLGGFVAVATALYPSERDVRVRAVAAAAVPGCDMPPGTLAPVRLPVLLLHGTQDDVIYYPENAVAAFEAVTGPRWLVTLAGGTHAGMAGLATELLSMAGNTDDISCTSMRANGTVTAAALARMATTFGADPASVAGCTVPCTLPVTMTPGMDPARQVRMVRLAMVAFLEAFVAGDDGSGEAFLDRGVAAEGADVTVRTGPR